MPIKPMIEMHKPDLETFTAKVAEAQNGDIIRVSITIEGVVKEASVSHDYFMSFIKTEDSNVIDMWNAFQNFEQESEKHFIQLFNHD